MNIFILSITLLLLTLAGIVVRKTYNYVPLREMKRRAEHHDRVATQLYRAAAYKSSLSALLWLYIGLTAAGSFIVLSRSLPVWASLFIAGPLLWAGFSMLPATRTTKLGIRLTLLVNPAIVWLLNYLHPLLNRASEKVEFRYVAAKQTGIFEREDLIKLIEKQQEQPENRLSEEELEIAKRALSFDDYRVADILTPRKLIKTVMADDTIGPILIDEVHQSGQDSVLVKEAKKGPIIGSLSVSKLNIHSEGKIRDIMNPTVYYLHEDDSLSQALHAFFLTNYPVFIVVNGFEEYIGVLSIEAVIKQLLGHIPGDDFDQYSQMEVVAHRHSKRSKKEDAEDEIETISDETPVKTDKEVVE